MARPRTRARGFRPPWAAVGSGAEMVVWTDGPVGEGYPGFRIETREATRAVRFRCGRMVASPFV